MKITYLDIVDWEPLTMTFVAQGQNQADAKEAAAFVESYFEENDETEDEDEPEFPEYYLEVNVEPNGSIVAKCEFISDEAVEALANALAAKFPQYVELELGHRAKGLPQSKSIIWINFNETTETIDGLPVSVGPFAISRFHISIEQYFQFLEETEFVPYMLRHGMMRDVIASFMGCQIAAGGKSQMRWPVTHITLKDAEAYCRWLGVRLPTAAELTVFCKWVVDEKVQMQFTSDCWTSTKSTDGQIVVLTMPWFSEKFERDWKVTAYSADRWEHPFISFRVCRDRTVP